MCRADVRDEDIHLTPDELPLEQWRPEGIDAQIPLQVPSRAASDLVGSGVGFSSGACLICNLLLQMGSCMANWTQAISA